LPEKPYEKLFKPSSLIHGSFLIVLERFKPKDLINTVFEITPAFLEQRGLKALLLDIDNTIVPHGKLESSDLDLERVRVWLAPLKNAGITLRFVSNALPTRIRFHAEALGIKAVGTGNTAGKPFAPAFQTAIAELGLPPKQIAMLGDQVFTDVLGANNAGMYSILVRPMSDNSKLHTHAARMLERLVLKHFGLTW
jgi:uncharacterized protein